MSERRPRVLIDALAYAPNDGGFAEGLLGLLDSCREIPEFEFVVAHHARFTEVFGKYGLRTVTIPFAYRFRYLLQPLLLPLLARRVGADIVFCENTAYPWLTGAQGIVTVHDLHFMKDDRVEDKTLAQRFYRRVYWQALWARSIRRAKVVKAISSIAATETHELIEPSAPVLVVPVRINVGPEYPPQTWPVPGEPLRLLWLGSIVPRKNIAFLLRSLPKFTHDWVLDVAGNAWWDTDAIGGDWPDDARVTVHGWISAEEKERLYEQAHILITPSIDEGFGRAPAEALSRGRLALTSDIAAFREYVPDACRFSLDDPDSLVRLFNSLDAERYAALIASGAGIRARFSRAAHIQGHRDLLETAIA